MDLGWEGGHQAQDEDTELLPSFATKTKELKRERERDQAIMSEGHILSV